MSHGFFETLQGNSPAAGLFISAIGESQRMWPHGNEYAFTLIQNYLITGIVSLIIGLCIIVWSICFIHRKNGPVIFLLLFTLLFLTGGGIAQIFFFPLFWLVSTRINKPLNLWQRILPLRVHKLLSKFWVFCLLLSSILMLFILEIAITGFIPAVNDPDTVLSTMLSFLAIEMIIIPFTLSSGFSYDILNRSNL